MIVTGTYTTTEHPVIVDLRTALGEAIDRQQVAIVRDHLAAVPASTRCALHPAFEPDYCPSCGTSQRIGNDR